MKMLAILKTHTFKYTVQPNRHALSLWSTAAISLFSHCKTQWLNH